MQQISQKVESMLYEKPLAVDYESVEDGSAVGKFTNALMSLKYKGITHSCSEIMQE